MGGGTGAQRGSETYTLPTALAIADRLHDLGVRWFEEPIPQVNRAAITRLCAQSRVPIAYGEHLYGREDALDALGTSGISVFQPDVSVSGGIAECRESAALAAYYGARVVPRNAPGRCHSPRTSFSPRRCRRSAPSSTRSASYRHGTHWARALH